MELFLYHFRLWGTTLDQVFLGSKAFGTIHPKNMEAILSTQFGGKMILPANTLSLSMTDFGYGPRRNIVYPLLGDGIFTQEGQAWKRSRELLKPQFARSLYRDLNVFDAHIDNFIQCVPSNGGVIDLQPLFFRFTLDTTTAFLFGKSVDSLSENCPIDNAAFSEDFNVAQDYLAKRHRLMDLYWLIDGFKFRRACKAVHKFLDTIIDQSLKASEDDAGKNEHYVFLNVVAQHCHDRQALRNQLMNILIAGRDTTACMLSWTL
jgi:cytochrome P450